MKKITKFITTIWFLLCANAVLAFEAPEEGALFYEMYDIVVIKIFGGAIGYVAAFFAILGGIYMLVQQKWLLSVLLIASAGVFIGLENVLTTFGYVLI